MRERRSLTCRLVTPNGAVRNLGTVHFFLDGNTF